MEVITHQRHARCVGGVYSILSIHLFPCSHSVCNTHHHWGMHNTPTPTQPHTFEATVYHGPIHGFILRTHPVVVNSHPGCQWLFIFYSSLWVHSLGVDMPLLLCMVYTLLLIGNPCTYHGVYISVSSQQKNPQSAVNIKNPQSTNPRSTNPQSTNHQSINTVHTKSSTKENQPTSYAACK